VYNGATQESRLQPGHPVGAFYGYQIIGLFQSYDDVNKSAKQDGAAPGRFKYADVNHDGKITDSDRTFLEPQSQIHRGPQQSDLTIKHFDLFMLLYTSVGNKVLNGVKVLPISRRLLKRHECTGGNAIGTSGQLQWQRNEHQRPDSSCG